MSLEQLKAFLAKVKGDSSLQEKLKAATSPEDFVGIAKEHGHEFATEHMTQLSEDELEGLAGGSGSVLFCADAWNTNGVGGLLEGRGW